MGNTLTLGRLPPCLPVSVQTVGRHAAGDKPSPVSNGKDVAKWTIFEREWWKSGEMAQKLHELEGLITSCIDVFALGIFT